MISDKKMFVFGGNYLARGEFVLYINHSGNVYRNIYTYKHTQTYIHKTKQIKSKLSIKNR